MVAKPFQFIGEFKANKFDECRWSISHCSINPFELDFQFRVFRVHGCQITKVVCFTLVGRKRSIFQTSCLSLVGRSIFRLDFQSRVFSFLLHCMTSLNSLSRSLLRLQMRLIAKSSSNSLDNVGLSHSLSFLCWRRSYNLMHCCIVYRWIPRSATLSDARSERF